MNSLVLFELTLIMLALLGGRRLKYKEVQNDFLSKDCTIVLRGMAIILVMLQHTMGSLDSRIFTPFGGGGVAVFLVLSGYGLSESAKIKGIANFWRKKLISILLPWILVYSIFLVDWSNFSFFSYLGEILLVKTQCWYLQYLFVWYICFYLIHYFQLEKYQWFIMITLSLIIFLLWGDIQVEQAMTFMTGVWLSVNKDKIINLPDCKKTNCLILCIALSLFFLSIMQIPFIRSHFDITLLFHIIQLALKTFIAYAIIMFVLRFPSVLHNRFLSFTGMNSFELYLVHVFVTPRLLSCVDPMNLYLRIVLFGCISYLLSYLLYQFNNKLKRYLL